MPYVASLVLVLLRRLRFQVFRGHHHQIFFFLPCSVECPFPQEEWHKGRTVVVNVCFLRRPSLNAMMHRRIGNASVSAVGFGLFGLNGAVRSDMEWFEVGRVFRSTLSYERRRTTDHGRCLRVRVYVLGHSRYT